MSEPKLLGYKSCPHLGGDKLKYPVVLVRGLGRSGSFWLEFPEFLRKHTTVQIVDLLGTGCSPSTWGRGSITALAKDVVFTLREHKLVPCHLVGISLGGMVAAEVARIFCENSHFQNGSQLVSLSVFNSSARFTKEKRIAGKVLSKLLFSLRHKIPKNREFAHYLVSESFLKRVPDLPEVWDGLWEKEGFSKIAVVRQLLSAAFFDGAETLSKIEVPALFVASKEDALASWTNTPRLWESVPRAKMHVLDGVGHDLTTEKPEEVSELLLQFFREVES